MTTSPRYWTDPLSGSTYSFGGKLTSAQLNAYLAGWRAMDLALERSIVRNWPNALESTAVQDMALCWSPYAQMWICGYQNGANPEVLRGPLIAGMAVATAQPAAEEGLTVKGIAAHPTLGTVIMCGDPGSSSNHKYRCSTDGGDNWTSGHSTVTSTTSVNAICYHEVTGAGVHFVTGAEGGVIETTVTGGTWTARTAANANDISALASSGSAVVGVSSASTNKCVVSATGIDWVERTLPVTANWYGVCYLANQGFWLVAGTSGGTVYLAKSADAVTWTSVTHSGLTTGLNPRSMVSSGNFAVFVNASVSGRIYVSEDVGTSWRSAMHGEGPAATYGTPSALAVATRDGIVSQLMASYQNGGTRNRFASHIA